MRANTIMGHLFICPPFCVSICPSTFPSVLSSFSRFVCLSKVAFRAVCLVKYSMNISNNFSQISLCEGFRGVCEQNVVKNYPWVNLGHSFHIFSGGPAFPKQFNRLSKFFKSMICMGGLQIVSRVTDQRLPRHL